MSDVMSLPDVTTAVSKCLATANITRVVLTVSLSMSRVNVLGRKSRQQDVATAAEQRRRRAGAPRPRRRLGGVLPRSPARMHGALRVLWEATPQRDKARTRRCVNQGA